MALYEIGQVVVQKRVVFTILRRGPLAVLEDRVVLHSCTPDWDLYYTTKIQEEKNKKKRRRSKRR